ncbi:MAG: DUF3224 domain-containing protein [Kofleriaceae bacterium]
MQAKGSFEIQMTPEPPYFEGDGISLGRVAFTKQFAGDLAGTSDVQMIGARTAVAGSAGYVAIERVIATLGGRTGTFVLQHSGRMKAGSQTLTITVVPDSGTGELAGLDGTLVIAIVEGKHFYTFDYTLA